jgi:hypothetical protein
VNGQLNSPVTHTLPDDAVDESHTPDSGMATDNSMDEKLEEPELQRSPSVDQHNCSDIDVEGHEPVFDEDESRNEDACHKMEMVDSQAKSPSGNVEVKPFEQQAHFSLPHTAAVQSLSSTSKESKAAEGNGTETNSSESHDGQMQSLLSPVPLPPPLPKMKETNEAPKRVQLSDNFQKLVSVLERSQTAPCEVLKPALTRSCSFGSPSPCTSPTAMLSKASTMSLMPLPGMGMKAPRMETFDSLEKHTRGIFRKKVSIANMLSWTKDSISKPMILQRDRKIKRDAVDLFKMVQIYMGDRRAKKNPIKVALEIVSRCWTSPPLRDELYIQLARQTTGNSNAQSLLKGWELFSISLGFFPPSNKFHSYLEGYIYRHLEPDTANYKGVPVSVHANYCYKRLERMRDTGAKRGLKKPTAEEIERARAAPFHPSMFGNTLEDAMELQKEKFPNSELPWIVTTLCEKMLVLGALETEGVFRVPGDIDEVNALKLVVDKFEVSDNLKDPHVPGSLLKLWFRDLYDPLIPQHYYDECLYNCNNSANAVSVADSLPEQNRLVLMYIVRFLQGFSRGDVVQHTKMDISNLAMVWAPNFLRCPSTDPLEIFENTRKEMTFLRTLIEHWDTSDVEGMV